MTSQRSDCKGEVLPHHLCFVDGVIQYTALVWVKEFVSLSGRDMLPFASGILTAVLPCLAYDEKHRKSILFGTWDAEKLFQEKRRVNELFCAKNVDFQCLRMITMTQCISQPQNLAKQSVGNFSKLQYGCNVECISSKQTSQAFVDPHTSP